MSDRELITEYKHTILELTQEKKDLNKLIEEKDAKIKKILIQLEQANTDTQSAGKKIAELEKKLNKKQAIKRVIDEKITEILENTSEIDEKKDDESVDN
jgi:chromosome segregation ATPase|tara:strand:- start:26 stop:322 length:297 start_codon:yes stop_codon:yes gene_type:complete